MAPRDTRDLWGGVLFAALGLAMLSWAIPYHVDADPDLRLPVDTMPKVVAILLVLLGTLLAGRAILVALPQEPSKKTSEDAGPARMMGVFAMAAAATLAMTWLPYLVVMPILAIGLALFFGSRNLVRLVPVAIAPVLIFLFVRYGFERLLP